MLRSTVEQNLRQIEECYKNSGKKLVAGKYETKFFNMVAKFGLLGLSYLLICFLIVFGTPFISIWRQKKSIRVQSHV